MSTHQLTDGRNISQTTHGIRLRILACSLLCALALCLATSAAAQEFVATGTYTGDNVAGHAITGVGFAPDLVIVKGGNNESAVIRMATMGGGISRDLGDVTVYYNNGIFSLDGDGFTLGSHNAVNETGVQFEWVAMREEPGVMDIGSYWGNGISGSAIGVGAYQPDAALVIAEDFYIPHYRHTDMPLDVSAPLVGGGINSGGLERFYIGGFQLGSEPEVNAAGTFYHYICWNFETGLVGGAAYLGDGQDDRDITGLGMSPAWLLIKSAENEDAQHRTANLAGDNTLLFTNDEHKADRIQELLPDGFQLGKHNSVNDNDKTFYYVAFWNRMSDSDLTVNLVVDTPTAAEGDTLAFEVRVDNTGPDDAADVLVAFPAPAGTTFLSADTATGSYDSGTGIWNLGAFADGASESLTLQVTVDAGSAGTTVTVQAAISGDGVEDANLDDNTDSVPVDISENADLALIHTVSSVTAAPGDTLVFVTRITNNGPGDATGVEITHSAESGLLYLSDSVTAGSYNSGLNTWTLGDIAAGAVDSLVLTTQVKVGEEGETYVHDAAVNAADVNDAIPDNDSDTVTIHIGDLVDLGVSVAVEPSAAAEGDTVTVTVVAANAGPGDASVIEVANTIPAGLTLLAFDPGSGAYTEGTGVWIPSPLAAGETDTLTLQAAVDPGTAGDTLLHAAAVSVSGETDPNSANDTASAGVDIHLPVDLTLTLEVSDTAPAVGDTIHLLLMLDNTSANDADGIAVTAAIPAGLTFLSGVPTSGLYDDGTGIWDLGSLAAGLTDTLALDLVVGDGVAGTDILFQPVISGLDQPDSVPDDNSIDLTFEIRAETDLSVTLTVDEANPAVGETVVLTAAVRNHGPAGDANLLLQLDIPEGLDYSGHAQTAGTFTAGTGVWDLAALAIDAGDTLTVSAVVAEGYETAELTAALAISGSDDVDPVAANDIASAVITVQAAPAPEIRVTPLAGEESSVPQNGELAPVLRFELSNAGTAPDTLHSLTITNRTVSDPEIGDATQEQLDAAWKPLSLIRELSVADAEKALPPTAVFSGGVATFANLDFVLDAGRTITLTVNGAASAAAPDGYRLHCGIASDSDLQLARTTATAADWPVVSGEILAVDGFPASLMELVPVESDLLAVGSLRNPALEIVLPPNGFLPDVLTRLNVINYGSALPEADIDRMEAWADDGDEDFDSMTDQWLGSFVYTGDRWELTGLSADVPLGGLRVHVTVDITETATPTGTAVRLGIPGPPDEGVGMASANDGPVDGSLDNPFAMGISVSDRVILTTQWIHSGSVYPAASDLPLILFEATNTYADDRTLQRLSVTNTTVGAGGATQAELDAAVRQLILRLDGDGDGLLGDLTSDPALAAGSFADGLVDFDGLDYTLPAGVPVRFFVCADLGLATVADGDLISAEISELGDVAVSNSTIVAGWPLNSGARWTVDGMIADQLTVEPISVLTLGPGDGPALAFDVTVPANGYLTDELLGLNLVNTGTAESSDLSAMELWADGGDGVFDAGAGDDQDLGPMIFQSGSWVSPALDRTIPAEGLRLFASLVVSAAPQDSATVRLAAPVGGVTTASGNSGPLDREAVETGTLVLSTSPLLSSVAFQTGEVIVGQAGEVRMTVSNRGGETVETIAPVLETAGGSAVLALDSPSPSSLDLAPGESAEFSWSFTCSAPGTVYLEGSAAGTGQATSLVRRSVSTPTSDLRVYTPVPGIDLYPTTNLPFSINRGQTGVVPLILTLANPGDENVADGRLNALTLRLIETVDGPDLAPADLIERFVIAEGTDIYADVTALPTAPGAFTVALDRPAIITGDEPVTLSVMVNLRADSDVPSFVLSIDQADWFTLADAVGGGAIALSLGEGTFPVQSGQGNLVTQATSLEAAIVDLPVGYAGPGQTGVVLGEMDLSNLGIDGSASAIELGELALAFLDSNGRKLADPARVFSRIGIATSFQNHFSAVPAAGADSLVHVQLSPPVLVPGNTTLTLRLSGDVADDPPLGAFRPQAAAAEFFDARDANTGAPVVLTLATAPEAAATVIVGPAENLQITGEALLAATVPQGALAMPALGITLEHPGAAGTAPIVVESLALDFFDAGREPLNAAAFLDRLYLTDGVTEFATVGHPVTENGRIVLPVTGLTIPAGQSAPLQFRFDFRPDAPGESIEMSLATANVVATDGVRGTPVAVGGPAASLFTGSASVVVAPDELVVSGSSCLPAILAAQAEPFAALALTFSNPAATQSGAIAVDEIRVTQPAGSGAALGDAVQQIRVTCGGDVWTTVDDLEAGDRSVTLRGEEPLLVPADGETGAMIEILLAGAPPGGSLVLQIAEGGIDARPQDVATANVFVHATSGQSFPLVTDPGTLSAAGLEESYANFPNPFEPGREKTTFVYSLSGQASVTLRLLTPYGEAVATLLESAPRGAGLHQDDTWDGRNGNGEFVRNGVYLAELVVEYSNGSRERVLRKVAVVR